MSFSFNYKLEDHLSSNPWTCISVDHLQTAAAIFGYCVFDENHMLSVWPILQTQQLQISKVHILRQSVDWLNEHWQLALWKMRALLHTKILPHIIFTWWPTPCAAQTPMCGNPGSPPAWCHSLPCSLDLWSDKKAHMTSSPTIQFTEGAGTPSSLSSFLHKKNMLILLPAAHSAHTFQPHNHNKILTTAGPSSCPQLWATTKWPPWFFYFILQISSTTMKQTFIAS